MLRSLKAFQTTNEQKQYRHSKYYELKMLDILSDNINITGLPT